MLDEYLTVTQARRQYHISTEKMKRLLRDNVIPWTENPNDARVKLILRADVEQWSQNAAKFAKPKDPRTLRKAQEATS